MPQTPIATLAELWSYPVKGMRGQPVASLALDAYGIAGERRFAIQSSGAPHGKPMLSGAERAAMLLFAAESQGDEVLVITPSGQRFRIDDPALLRAMQQALPGGHVLSLVRSAKPLNDVRPVALLGTATPAQLTIERTLPVDARRFRANLLLAMRDNSGFAEDRLVGATLRIGREAELRITERIPRCRIVTLDPDTAAPDPSLMKHLDRQHDGCVGIYATVVHPGVLHVGDSITLIE